MWLCRCFHCFFVLQSQTFMSHLTHHRGPIFVYLSQVLAFKCPLVLGCLGMVLPDNRAVASAGEELSQDSACPASVRTELSPQNSRRCECVVYAYNPGAGEGEIPHQPASSMSLRLCEKNCSGNKANSSIDVTSKMGLWLPHTQAHVHPYPHPR